VGRDRVDPSRSDLGEKHLEINERLLRTHGRMLTHCLVSSLSCSLSLMRQGLTMYLRLASNS
jgi:hypothetical protein